MLTNGQESVVAEVVNNYLAVIIFYTPGGGRRFPQNLFQALAFQEDCTRLPQLHLIVAHFRAETAPVNV